jgi:hypothetical protein
VLARERREQLVAGVLAAAAFLGAQAAVLVVVGVALALLGACAARRAAGLESGQLDGRIGVGLAREDAAGADTRVSTVQTEAKAPFQRADVVLGEGGVGADRACGCALPAFVDASSEDARLGDERPGMCVEDRFDAHVLSLRVFDVV